MPSVAREASNTKPWETVRKFNDGELAIFVMKQESITEGFLPRYSYRIGRTNGDVLTPHIPVYAKGNKRGVEVTYPSNRLKELMFEAEEWIDKELQIAHNAP